VRRDQNVFADDVEGGPLLSELLRLIGEILLRRIVADEADVIR